MMVIARCMGNNQERNTLKTSPSLHGDGHGRLYGIAKGGVEDRSFPSTSVVRGLSWFYVSLLHLAPGIRFLVLHFSSMPCFAVVSVFMKKKYVAGIFTTFLLLDCESPYSQFFFCFQFYYLFVLVDGGLIPPLLDGC